MSQNWDLPKDTIICKSLMEIHLRRPRLLAGVGTSHQIRSKVQLKNYSFIFKQTLQVGTFGVYDRKLWPEINIAI